MTTAPPRGEPAAPLIRSERQAIAWLTIVVSLGLAVLTAAHWVDSGRQLIVVAAALRWFVALAVAGIFLVSLLTRHRVAITIAGLLLAVHCALAAPAVMARTTTTPGAPTVTVMSSNLLYGRADLFELARAAKQKHVDVLVLTEVTELGDRLKASGLTDAYPYRVGREVDTAKGTLVLSRWPLTELDSGQNQYFDNPLVSVATPAGPVRVLGVHSASPGPSWRHDLRLLGERQLQRGGPIILAGDFNSTVDHVGLRKATNGFTDALPVAGRGWLPTWNVQSLPFAQIDHVFVSGFNVRDAGRVVISDTDHAVVWATLERS